MRPAKLAPLFATVRSLKGVGPKVEKLLNKLAAPRHEGAYARVVDLLWHLPVGLIDRAMTPRIAEVRITASRVTIGDDLPSPGTLVRHATKASADQSTGNFSSCETATDGPPRQAGHWALEVSIDGLPLSITGESA